MIRTTLIGLAAISATGCGKSQPKLSLENTPPADVMILATAVQSDYVTTITGDDPDIYLTGSSAMNSKSLFSSRNIDEFYYLLEGETGRAFLVLALEIRNGKATDIKTFSLQEIDEEVEVPNKSRKVDLNRFSFSELGELQMIDAKDLPGF